MRRKAKASVIVEIVRGGRVKTLHEFPRVDDFSRKLVRGERFGGVTEARERLGRRHGGRIRRRWIESKKAVSGGSE